MQHLECEQGYLYFAEFYSYFLYHKSLTSNLLSLIILIITLINLLLIILTVIITHPSLSLKIIINPLHLRACSAGQPHLLLANLFFQLHFIQIARLISSLSYSICILGFEKIIKRRDAITLPFFSILNLFRLILLLVLRLLGF